MENVLSAPNHLDDPIYSEPLDEKFIPCVSVIHHLPVHSASQPDFSDTERNDPHSPFRSSYSDQLAIHWTI